MSPSATCACEAGGPPAELEEKVSAVLEQYRGRRGALIPVLQGIQKACGYLPRPALEMAAAALGLPLARVYGVATFYAQFHLKPRGRHIIRVCLGTACHVRGAEAVLDAVCETLDIQPGGTTDDLMFTLERVACLGACGLAPVMMIDDRTIGKLTPDKARYIVQGYRSDEEALRGA